MRFSGHESPGLLPAHTVEFFFERRIPFASWSGYFSTICVERPLWHLILGYVITHITKIRIFTSELCYTLSAPGEKTNIPRILGSPVWRQEIKNCYMNNNQISVNLEIWWTFTILLATYLHYLEFLSLISCEPLIYYWWLNCVWNTARRSSLLNWRIQCKRSSDFYFLDFIFMLRAWNPCKIISG